MLNLSLLMEIARLFIYFVKVKLRLQTHHQNVEAVLGVYENITVKVIEPILIHAIFSVDFMFSPFVIVDNRKSFTKIGKNNCKTDMGFAHCDRPD